MENMGIIVLVIIIIILIIESLYSWEKHPKCPKCSSKFEFSFSYEYLIWFCTCGYKEGDKIDV